MTQQRYRPLHEALWALHKLIVGGFPAPGLPTPTVTLHPADANQAAAEIEGMLIHPSGPGLDSLAGRLPVLVDPRARPGFGILAVGQGTTREVQVAFFVAWRCARCARPMTPPEHEAPFRVYWLCGDCAAPLAEEAEA